MSARIFILLFLAVSFVSAISAQVPTPPDLHVKLSLSENKTAYRIGEPIKLVLEFSADREGYVIEVTPDRDRPTSDTFIVSPETGVAHWLDDLNDNYRIPRDVKSEEPLRSATKKVEIIVNDTLRFDNPGRYTISVNTRRVRQQREYLLLSTNSIAIELQAMSEADEAKEVKRISELLDTKRDFDTSDEMSRQLKYLTGEPSTREKVRRFLLPDQPNGNYSANIAYGLFVARDRGLVLKLLEAAFRDPNVPVTWHLLQFTTRMKMLMTYGVTPRPVTVNGLLQPVDDTRNREIQAGYLVDLAASLPKRTGRNQTTTALTIFTLWPRNQQPDSPALREAGRTLLQQFDLLSPDAQAYLLRMTDQFRDPSLIPSLKKMLATTGTFATSVHEAALRRLIEMAPDEARSYVIAEIRDPSSVVDPKVLGALKDESLPEVDAALLEQIRRLAPSAQPRDGVVLKGKTALLVRFATDSIYRELMQLYRELGTSLARDGRPGLLAYFAKHNESEAIPLIEQAVAELKPGEDPRLLAELTALYYSDAIGIIVKKLLETDDVAMVSQAAYLIGEHGSASDQKLLEARLKRWRDQWRNRAAEADAQQQGRIERELVSALIRGKAWQLPPERARELQLSCITQLCKESNLVP
jgi:hypothetical protein